MNNILSEITNRSMLIFENRNKVMQEDSPIALLHFDDPILYTAQRRVMFNLTFTDEDYLASLLLTDPDIATLVPKGNELYPFISTQFGGIRFNPKELFSYLFSSAFMQMYFLGIEENENNYVRLVLKCFEDLKKQ
jgi:hypothetical protein